MIGVLVNVITVIIGSCVGLLFKKGIPERVSSAAMTGLGACTLYIGISGSLCGENVLILIASIVLGVITGTLLCIDSAINRLARKAEEKFKKGTEQISIAEGLVTATLLFCVGSMTVTGLYRQVSQETTLYSIPKLHLIWCHLQCLHLPSE